MTAGLPTIGSRFLLSGHIGTIKFVGSVHDTTGTWLGVEWDDPQRGKHDGAKGGVQYFTCTWVPFGPAGQFSYPPPVLVEFLDQDHSFGRHPLSNTGQHSYARSFRNTWKIFMGPRDKNLSFLVHPMVLSRSRP